MRRKCKICKAPARWQTSCGKAYCSPECGTQVGLMLLAKRKERQAKEEKRVLRKRKDALNDTVPIWTKKVQDKFNAYIRERDKDEPCPSCGRMDEEIKEFPRGGKWDAGHYLSVGAFPELRFEPLNCHKQCKSCNAGSGKYTKKNHTVAREYRLGLIKKIGIEQVEWLEGPHPKKHYRVPELKELYAYWSKMLKEEKSKNAAHS